MDGAHRDVEQQPIAGIDEEQRWFFLRKQVVGANRRHDKAKRDAKGSQDLDAERQVHRIGRERVGQRPRGDQAEGKGTAVDRAHIALPDLLFGQADRAHPFLAHDRAIPDAANDKARQRGEHDGQPVHVKYVHCILPRMCPGLRRGPSPVPKSGGLGNWGALWRYGVSSFGHGARVMVPRWAPAFAGVRGVRMEAGRGLPNIDRDSAGKQA